jgi:ubiquinone/menaquinone biosynthesis C-methylase UbiE
VLDERDLQSHPAVRFFDSAAQHYQSKHYGAVRSFMTVRQERVLQFIEQLALPRGARVLDAGCGPGYLVQRLATSGLQVWGLDAAKNMLEAARARTAGAQLEFPVTLDLGSIEHLPYRDESFDLVCSTGVIEYLEKDTGALSEMFRVLRPGGHLILPVTNIWSPINWLDFLLESLKRRDTLRRAFNVPWQRLGGKPVLPRHFRVRRHHPGHFRASLASIGFEIEDSTYFYFLPWPHPVDQLLPATSAAVGRPLERLGKSWIGLLAEGYLALAVKPVRAAVVVTRTSEQAARI